MKRDFQQLPSQATPMPYLVSGLADLPGSLQEAAVQSAGPAERLVSICVFPGRTHLKDWHSREEVLEQALLFTENGIRHIQAPAASGQAARTVGMEAAALIYARLSLILMYGRLELVDQSLSRVEVEFNAAGFEMIRPGLQSFMGTSCGRNAISQPDAAFTNFVMSELGERSYKFMNGLKLYGLLPGEQVLGFVFQPALWGRRWRILPMRMSETTLLALTDRQLIVVEEQTRSRFPAYGWILTFHPRHAIEKIGVTSSMLWQEVILKMKSNTGLIDRSILLDQANASAWQELWSRCQ